MPRETTADLLARAVAHARLAISLVDGAAPGIDWRTYPPEVATLCGLGTTLRVHADNLRHPPPRPVRFVRESDALVRRDRERDRRRNRALDKRAGIVVDSTTSRPPGA